jgi:hypothetical protein
LGEQWHHQLRVGKQLVVEGAADVRSELLVEEVLELERATTLRLILGIERRLRPPLLDRGDDPRRVADRAPVGREYWCCRGVAGQAPGLYGVETRQQRAANVGDALIVKCPPHLLDVVRDLELPQHGEDQAFSVAHTDGGAVAAEPARIYRRGYPTRSLVTVCVCSVGMASRPFIGDVSGSGRHE